MSPREQSGDSLQALPVFWRDFLELEVAHSVPDPRGGREDETHLTAHRVNKETGRENMRHSALKGKGNSNYWTSRDEDNRKVRSSEHHQYLMFPDPSPIYSEPALSAIP